MDVSPSDAVVGEDGEGDLPAVAGEAGEGAADDVAEERSIGLKDMLLSTEPPMTPSSVQAEWEVGPAGANAYIGVRKMLSAAFPSLSERSGTTALENFMVAIYHFATGGEDEDQERDQEDVGDLGAAVDAGDVGGGPPA